MTRLHMRGRSGRVDSRNGDRGSATVLALACLAVLLLVGSALGVAAAMVRAHRSAQAAADLAALAAASAVSTGLGDPCTDGGRAARSNGAELLTCQVSGATVLVMVQVAGPRWLGQESDLRAQARAGPVAAGG